MKELIYYCENTFLPYMTRKTLNKKHTAYQLKNLAERDLNRYVSKEEFQKAMAILGFPVSDYYPLSEQFFINRYNKRRKRGGGYSYDRRN